MSTTFRHPLAVDEPERHNVAGESDISPVFTSTTLPETPSVKDEQDEKTITIETDNARVDRKLVDLSEGEVHQFPGTKREHWWQLWRPRHSPPPPKSSLEDAEIIPLAYASILSRMTFWWVTPIMTKGYQRPLQATDLWKMDPSREAGPLSDKFLEALATRQANAREWNRQLPNAIPTIRQRLVWCARAMNPKRKGKTYSDRLATQEREWRIRTGLRHGSLTWALNDVVKGFWGAGLFKVAGDVSQLMIPLVLKAIINFSQEVYAARNERGASEPNIARGVAMAIGLFCLTIMQSVCQAQFFFRSMATGVVARGTLITATYKQAMRLSVNGRTQHPNGRLTTYISSDISRIDYCAQWFHAAWTAPIQLTITLALLLVQIGPSAIAGFSLFILLAPVQTWFMRLSGRVRRESMQWTDLRARSLRELLSSMEIIKVFTYEEPFLKRVNGYRRREMIGIAKILIIRAANQALAFSIPTLASVLAFVTYASTHDTFDPAKIFTSLAFFNLLRQPLMFLPRALASITDAQNAIGRLEKVFEADTIESSIPVDTSMKAAINIQDATFSWGEVRKEPQSEKLSQIPESAFELANLDLTVPRGSIVAVVGPVGSGKSSLLQGLIGEMSLRSGKVILGGRLAYCQQTAWIQNATVRDNILFGQPWDEQKYWTAVRNACLVPDLEILPDGDLSEIGEKGINLSGGQKQRVNIARALYYDSDIILFDDPLSAVDAHVGQSLFTNAIMPLKRQGKGVVLVTHAAHFLPAADYIYVMSHGRIKEHGTYTQLIQAKGDAARLFLEFGQSESADDQAGKNPKNNGEPSDVHAKPDKKSSERDRAGGTGKAEGKLMVSETRKTGSVGRKVYAGYLRAGHARYTFSATVICAAIMQASQVSSTVWLTWWERNRFDQPQRIYEGVYAALGLSQTLFNFGMGTALGIMANFASRNLHGLALGNVFYSPKSMFDTQPLGRILGIFGKDIDTIDNQLADSLRMLFFTLITLTGSVIIITVYLHYFLAAIFAVAIGYWYFANFYRTSSREIKRLDSMLRSLLYSHFSESLSGLATIHAYNETPRFIRENAHYMDLQNRAYLLTVTNQRWLAIRLDFLGAWLVFAVAIMCVKGGAGLLPAEIALCLTYLINITQILGMVTRQAAEVENNMNAVERVLWYSSGETVPREAAQHRLDTLPATTWPAEGAIAFKNVVMSYRSGLPPVLKGLSLDIRGGEKIGIVGRTGAGKTSITMALFRLVEITSGKITIDGTDISTLGLHALRSRIAIIPQEPVLFSGTIRSNLDPFDLYDDARLNDALVRACVVDKDDDGSRRLRLDSKVEEEGQNLSVGERSLVSLARAIVKDSRVVVLDEATAAVDLETDSRIQETITREFRSKTLLCIAHRLRTVISYDRILVMSEGRMEEFASPVDLYHSGGLFRAMCEKSEISIEDIYKARDAP